MSNFFIRAIEKINWKHWLFFFLLSQSIYVLMLTVTIPRITREAGGMKIFDMMPFGYTEQYASSFLSHLSEKGFSLYRYVQLPLDIFFPVFNFLAGACMVVLLLRLYCRLRHAKMNRNNYILLWTSISLSFVAFLSDYIENILIVIMLLKKNVPITVVSAANIFTIIKSMSSMIFYFISVVIVLAISVRWIKNKLRENKKVGELQFTREEKSSTKDSYPK